MFKPYRYKKAHVKNDGTIKRAFSAKPQVGLFFAKSFLSSILILFGVVVLVTKVLVPGVVIYANSVDDVPMISPIPEGSKPFAKKASDDDHFTFEELSAGFMQEVSYKKSDGILYPEFIEEKIRAEEDVPEYFYITIPKLDIENAQVQANSTNLDPKKALGHYNGSCLPDEGCNTFIFGHSSYVGAANKYEEGDYSTIFARLGELEYGDEFQIGYKGETFRYVVDLTKVQKPEDVNPLGSPIPTSLGRHESTVELFSCIPPGTTKFRLSVVGKLVS